MSLIFQDVFDVKRNKNMDRYQDLSMTESELFSAPSTVLNPIAMQLQEKRYRPMNVIEDWPEQTDSDIEALFYSLEGNPLVKEMPLSL